MTDNKAVTPVREIVRRLNTLVPEGVDKKAYLSLVKKMLMNNAQANVPVEDLMYFMATCHRTGLDPMAKQIYAVYRKSDGVPKLTIMTSIDGLRVIAERSGVYAGSDDAVYEEANNLPAKATVTVYRINPKTGERMPVTASARYSEYAPSFGSPLWKKMPFLMLGKVAEALALRKAFPNYMGGVYTDDEMAQANNLPPVATKTGATVTIPQRVKNVNEAKEIAERLRKQATDGDELHTTDPKTGKVVAK
jgi:phage recombination protein Bet